jgi:hypothetical protein
MIPIGTFSWAKAAGATAANAATTTLPSHFLFFCMYASLGIVGAGQIAPP